MTRNPPTSSPRNRLRSTTLPPQPGSTTTATLYRTTGPAFGPTFDAAQVQAISVGTITVDFTDPNSATLNYTVDGVSSTKTIARQIF